MAVVTVALRQRTTIAVLRVKDDVIVLQTMMWPNEIRTPDFTVEAGDVKDAEVKMAHMLVETLAGDFDASDFEDDYAGAVEALVKSKIEGGEIKRTETSTKTSGEVVDLLAALQKSVATRKTARGEENDEKPAAKKAPAKKKSAKQAATKKPAKKAPAKKTAAKKATETSHRPGHLTCAGHEPRAGRPTSRASSALSSRHSSRVAADRSTSSWSASSHSATRADAESAALVVSSTRAVSCWCTP